MYVSKQEVERRIALLAGPHFHAVLMASLDRFNYAHLSWGKKFLRKFSTTNGY